MSLSTATQTASVVVSGSAVNLPIIDGSVTLDETWSPYVQIRLELDPIADATYTALDPRATPIPAVTIALAETAGTWNSFTRPASSFTADGLLVRSRTRNEQTGIVTLTLASTEAQLDEILYDRSTPGSSSPLTSTTLGAFTSGVLLYGSLPFALVYTDPVGGAVAVPSGSVYNAPGLSLLDVLQPILQANLLRVFADEHGGWSLVKSPYDLPDSAGVVIVAGDPGYNITAASEIVDLGAGTIDQQWFDAVWIYYKQDHNIDQAWATLGPAEARRWLVLEYDAVLPPGGGSAAAGILDRRQRLGLTQNVTAVSNYSAKPGMWIAVQDASDATWRAGRVVSVAHSLAAGTMTLRMRDLASMDSHAWLTDPVGVRWQDIPVGIDWTEDL